MSCCNPHTYRTCVHRYRTCVHRYRTCVHTYRSCVHTYVSTGTRKYWNMTWHEPRPVDDERRFGRLIRSSAGNGSIRQLKQLLQSWKLFLQFIKLWTLLSWILGCHVFFEKKRVKRGRPYGLNTHNLWYEPTACLSIKSNPFLQDWLKIELLPFRDRRMRRTGRSHEAYKMKHKISIQTTERRREKSARFISFFPFRLPTVARIIQRIKLQTWSKRVRLFIEKWSSYRLLGIISMFFL